MSQPKEWSLPPDCLAGNARAIVVEWPTTPPISDRCWVPPSWP